MLAIPASAVLDTGLRQVAYRLNKDGAYELVELKIGPRATAVMILSVGHCFQCFAD